MSPNIMRIQMGFKWNNEYYVYTYLCAYVYMYNDSMINTLISELYPQLLGFTNMTLGPLLVWNQKNDMDSGHFGFCFEFGGCIHNE